MGEDPRHLDGYDGNDDDDDDTYDNDDDNDDDDNDEKHEYGDADEAIFLYCLYCPGATLHQQVVSGVNDDQLAGTEEAPYPEPWSCSL